MSKKQNYFTSFIVYSLAAVLLLVGNPYLIVIYLVLLLVAEPLLALLLLLLLLPLSAIRITTNSLNYKIDDVYYVIHFNYSC